MKVPNASLLSQESILKGRFAPSGRIEGFTAEIGASGSYCPQHVTLPVDVTYFDISEHSVPSPFLVRGQGRAGTVGEVSGGCIQAPSILRDAPLRRAWLEQPPTRRDRWLCQEQFLTPKAKRERRGSPCSCINRQAAAQLSHGCCFAVTSVLLLVYPLVWRGTELSCFLLPCARCSWQDGAGSQLGSP